MKNRSFDAGIDCFWPCITIILNEFNNSVLLEFLAANWISYYFIKRKNIPRFFEASKLFIVVEDSPICMLNQSEQVTIKVCVCVTFRKMGGRNPYMLQSFKAR